MAKLYPFSVRKHQHDVDFYYHRIWLYIRKIEDGEVELTNSQIKDLYNHFDNKVKPLREKMYNGTAIAWLTGPELGLARTIVNWAVNLRAERLIEHGKHEWLAYV